MPRGRKPTCECGACQKCRRRAARQGYDREYRMRPGRKERHAEYVAAWKERHPEKLREAAAKHHRENPEKAKARRALHYEIERGRLQREPCEVCGAEPAHGHHDDYDAPLDVRWLCPQHHAEHHTREVA